METNPPNWKKGVKAGWEALCIKVGPFESNIGGGGDNTWNCPTEKWEPCDVTANHLSFTGLR